MFRSAGAICALGVLLFVSPALASASVCSDSETPVACIASQGDGSRLAEWEHSQTRMSQRSETSRSGVKIDLTLDEALGFWLFKAVTSLYADIVSDVDRPSLAP